MCRHKQKLNKNKNIDLINSCKCKVKCKRSPICASWFNGVFVLYLSWSICIMENKNIWCNTIYKIYVVCHTQFNCKSIWFLKLLASIISFSCKMVKLKSHNSKMNTTLPFSLYICSMFCSYDYTAYMYTFRSELVNYLRKWILRLQFSPSYQFC